MDDQLKTHVAEALSRPFCRPQDDCCFFVVDWVLVKTGVDLAPDLRSSYVSEMDAARLVVKMGGFLRMWSDRMSAAGFSETEAPVVGDVAVVRDYLGGERAAVRVGGLWACKGTSGVVFEDFEVLRAWSIDRG